MYERLLIEIRIHIMIEEMHFHIEKVYQQVFTTIRNIKNLAVFVVIFYFICFVLMATGYFVQFEFLIHCGMYTLTFYCIFRIIDLYHCFQSDSNDLITNKNWILENDKNIPKLIEYGEINR